jgi:hypothetical protein
MMLNMFCMAGVGNGIRFFELYRERYSFGAGSKTQAASHKRPKLCPDSEEPKCSGMSIAPILQSGDAPFPSPPRLSVDAPNLGAMLPIAQRTKHAEMCSRTGKSCRAARLPCRRFPVRILRVDQSRNASDVVLLTRTLKLAFWIDTNTMC